MAYRELDRLTSEVQIKAENVLRDCKNRGVDLLIYCTLRTIREQAKLFRQGRSFNQIQKKMRSLEKSGYKFLSDVIEEVGPQYENKKVTNAGPGESWHNVAEAFDAVPLISGKAMWRNSHPHWNIYGECCVQNGLHWAGNWRTFKEYPHAQLSSVSRPTKVMGPSELKERLRILETL